MNKAELIAEVAKKTGVTNKVVTECVDALFSILEKQLVRGKFVMIQGFGKFLVRERAAREGRNPRTGETLQIAAKKSPAFTPGKQLKELVAAGKKKKSAK